ncbi:MAG TPA: pirin family protein [Azoarcus sp.]|nr:pirin family protein [Azoarcus sp.]
MIELRPYQKLGGGQHDWLDTRHHFSFAHYHDPDRMHWGTLRVWNDDLIAPHSGFPRHSHRDMEIITYVRKGAITHEDSLGNRGRTVAGDVQVMSAGTGIAHSELNEEDEATQIFQIWITPTASGLPPAWGTRPFPKNERSGAFVTLASGHADDLVGDEGPLRIRADARLVAATLKPGQSAEYHIAPGRKVYLVPASGQIEINGVVANAGDGVAVRDELELRVTAQQESEIVMVDVA